MKCEDGTNKPAFIAVVCVLFLALLFSLVAYFEYADFAAHPEHKDDITKNRSETPVVSERTVEGGHGASAATHTPEVVVPASEGAVEDTVAEKETEPSASKTKETELPAAETDRVDGISVVECDAVRSASPFYADPAAQVIKAEQKLREEGRSEDAALLREISCFPHSTWLLGDDDHEKTIRKVEQVVADAADVGKIPVFVLYNRPTHGSAGWGSGLSSIEYENWIEDIASAIGQHDAWVILEPDALATAAEYSTKERNQRTDELAEAVRTLASNPNARVYIDAGHSDWLQPQEAAALLRAANIDMARGFALNVSNFRRTENERAYGNALAAALGGAHFIIDTARNGNGSHPEAEWCNAPGRTIGERPRFVHSEQYLDALLWVKPAGESDGTCNGGPPAGTFWLEYALDLVRNRGE